MVDIILSLKTHARVFHRKVQAGDVDALARIRAVDEFKNLDDETISSSVKRRHCLAAIASEIGFSGWSHTLQVLQGKDVNDFGTLLYPGRCSAHLNIWCASHDEARRVRDARDGFLLGWRSQYIVVDDDYIRTLGLDPADPDWRRIGRDWVRPGDPLARRNLYGKLVREALNY